VVYRGPPLKAGERAPEGSEDGPGEVEDGEEPSEGAGSDPASPRANLVVVDHELSPSQLRNLAQAAGCEVLDRTGVILEIFHRNARSREARLQVELARLQILSPRLRETGGPSERQRGGIGGKGSGESDLELDRRKVRDRLAELRRELVEIESERTLRRARRQTQRQVALVGYTNAGKSSLMRALTGSELLVADQLFATLDTTVRALQPEVQPRILVTDTVGFIRDLPHELVASFRSTLDAALDAALLLHAVDASDPAFRSQLAVTVEVLSELGVPEGARLLVLNKVDRLDEQARVGLSAEFPEAVLTSVFEPARIAELHRRIVEHFARDAEERTLVLPWSFAGLVGRLRQEIEVLSESYADDGITYRLRGPRSSFGRLRHLLENEGLRLPSVRDSV
jgi:GTP-binding protein HflX